MQCFYSEAGRTSCGSIAHTSAHEFEVGKGAVICSNAIDGCLSVLRWGRRDSAYLRVHVSRRRTEMLVHDRRKLPWKRVVEGGECGQRQCQALWQGTGASSQHTCEDRH